MLKICSFVHRHSYSLLPSLRCEVCKPPPPSQLFLPLFLQSYSSHEVTQVHLINVILTCDNIIKTDLYQEIIIFYSDHNLHIVLILLFVSVRSPPHLPHPPLSQLFLSISIPSPQSLTHYCTQCSRQVNCLLG